MRSIQGEQRYKADRRRKPTSLISASSLYGSRTKIRRSEDQNLHYYVDRYNLASVAAVVATLVLSMLDLFFTLRLIDLGGEELNPIMDFFLNRGPYVFLLVKYFLTAFGMLLIILHQHYHLFNRWPVSYLLPLPPLFYLLLILYELRLLGLV